MMKQNIYLSKYIVYCIFFVISFLFVFFFSCTTSPFYEHYPFWYHGDSGIFQEMGICIVQGGTPYVDIFDHKGPVLWFIQALGIWINPHWGLMVLQTFFLFSTIIIWHKTISIFTNKQLIKNLLIGVSYFLLLCFYLRGNNCEEWSLPFISWPIYVYLKRQKEECNYSLLDFFLIGVCSGILAFIRLNNIAPFLGFIIWFYIQLLKNKNWKKIINSTLFFISGICIVFFPCAAFYYSKAGLWGVQEMLYGTFIFNFTYITKSQDWSFFWRLQYYIPTLGFIIITILCSKHENNRIIIPTIVSYILTLLTFGIRIWIHYLIIFIPLFILSMCLLFSSHAKLSKISYIILGSILMQCFITGYTALDCLAFRLTKEPPHRERHECFHRFISSLSPEERRSIYNANVRFIGHGLFADENIYQCNRCLDHNHLIYSDHLREYEATHGIKDLQPAWVLTQNPRPEASDEYMQNHYTLVDSIPGGEFDPIWCWKRNEK